MTDKINIVDVTADNVSDAGIYCIRNKKAPGFKKKVEWFKNRLNKGLRIKIAIDETGKQSGFIEYIPSELAWRPVRAENYFFIHCIAVFTEDAKGKNTGSMLLRMCEKDAGRNNKFGVCAMSSDGPWMANKTIFEKNGFTIIDRLGRFELMCKKFNRNGENPEFINWTRKQEDYQGWNLIYSDQCPMHGKSISDLRRSALENGIDLKIKKLNSPSEAQNAPSGFGTYSLIKDGKLIEDHYLSKTRFENILKKELKE